MRDDSEELADCNGIAEDDDDFDDFEDFEDFEDEIDYDGDAPDVDDSDLKTDDESRPRRKSASEAKSCLIQDEKIRKIIARTRTVKEGFTRRIPPWVGAVTDDLAEQAILSQLDWWLEPDKRGRRKSKANQCRTGFLFPHIAKSRAALARELSTTVTKIRRAMERLRDKGFVEWTTGMWGGNRILLISLQMKNLLDAIRDSEENGDY